MVRTGKRRLRGGMGLEQLEGPRACRPTPGTDASCCRKKRGIRRVWPACGLGAGVSGCASRPMCAAQGGLDVRIPGVGGVLGVHVCVGLGCVHV